VNRFVYVHCVASSRTWKRQANCRLYLPWKNFCGRPCYRWSSFI